MRLICGHVISKDALDKLASNSHTHGKIIKCPYWYKTIRQISIFTFILARRSRKPTKPKLYSFDKNVHFFIFKLFNSKSDTSMFWNSGWDCTTIMTRLSLAPLEGGQQHPSKQETCRCISRKWQSSGSSRQRFNSLLKWSNRFRRLRSQPDLLLRRFSSLNSTSFY